ncbi:hypothetical protein B0T16DRAFT_403227 [Cercophora newfieldiana]|uniref:Uncharacterized protein n=1 Tax=Cercophora newfieldiana TaxID=92897 RepID=A0AA40CTT9_9PEZI|nr:hypothetical protein B0T16DRAFT_403227 [Cercophora newfieldiana]
MQVRQRLPHPAVRLGHASVLHVHCRLRPGHRHSARGQRSQQRDRLPVRPFEDMGGGRVVGHPQLPRRESGSGLLCRGGPVLRKARRRSYRYHPRD